MVAKKQRPGVFQVIAKGEAKGALNLEGYDGKEEKRKSSKRKTKTAKLSFEKLGLDRLDLSDHIKARIGKEGDKDFKFKMMKQIFETDLKKHIPFFNAFESDKG